MAWVISAKSPKEQKERLKKKTLKLIRYSRQYSSFAPWFAGNALLLGNVPAFSIYSSSPQSSLDIKVASAPMPFPTTVFIDLNLQNYTKTHQEYFSVCHHHGRPRAPLPPITALPILYCTGFTFFSIEAFPVVVIQYACIVLHYYSLHTKYFFSHIKCESSLKGHIPVQV